MDSAKIHYCRICAYGILVCTREQIKVTTRTLIIMLFNELKETRKSNALNCMSRKQKVSN